MKGEITDCSLLQSAQAEDPLHGILFSSNVAAGRNFELHLLLVTPSLAEAQGGWHGVVTWPNKAQRPPHVQFVSLEAASQTAHTFLNKSVCCYSWWKRVRRRMQRLWRLRLSGAGGWRRFLKFSTGCCTASKYCQPPTWLWNSSGVHFSVECKSVVVMSPFFYRKCGVWHPLRAH